MKKFFKFIIVIALTSLACLTNLIAMDLNQAIIPTSNLGSNFGERFYELPPQMQKEILRYQIADFIKNFEDTRNFKELSKKIEKLRQNEQINELINKTLTPEFIDSLTKEINDNYAYPISKIALAKALLTQDAFEEYAEKYIDWDQANSLGLELIKYISKLPNYVDANQIDKIKNMIKKNPNLDIKNQKGDNALLSSINDGTFYKVVDLLIKAGANLNAVDNKGNSALANAINMVQMLEYNYEYDHEGYDKIIEILTKANAKEIQAPRPELTLLQRLILTTDDLLWKFLHNIGHGF